MELAEENPAAPAPASSPEDDTTFWVWPSVTTSNVRPGIGRLPVRIICYEFLTGNIIPNCDIVITHNVVGFSGGHDHHDPSRPKGTFNPSSGNTGWDGQQFVTIYEAPEPAGVIEVTSEAWRSDGTPLLPATWTIGVKVPFPSLEALPPGENYVLIGSYGEPGVTSQHVENHFGTPAFNAILKKIADKYAEEFPNAPKLEFNDMSLVKGGLFDLGNNWIPKHKTHRFGTDMDLRIIYPGTGALAIPHENRPRLQDIIEIEGIAIAEETQPPHWHLIQ